MSSLVQPPRIASIASALGLALTLIACGDDSSGPDAGSTPTNDAADDSGVTPADGGADSSLTPDGTADAAAPVVATNNSAVIDGDAISGSLSLNRKVLPVEVEGSHPDIALGDAYALGVGAGYVYYLYDVVNVGTVDRCLVSLADITYLDRGGQQLGELRSAYVRGSVRLVGQFAQATDTCLAPGQHAWAVEINATSGFDDVAGARLTVEVSEETTTLPGARLVPQSYALESSGRIAFQIENDSSVDAKLGLGNWVALDADGLPVGYSFLYVDGTEKGSDILAAGATMEISQYLDFAGVLTASHVQIDFEDASADLSMAPRSAALRDADASLDQLRALDAAARGR